MKYEQLQALSDEALVHRELQLERDLIAATFRLRTGQLDDSSQVGKLRKDIARARTAQRLREEAARLGRNALRDQHRATFKVGQQAPETGGAPTGGGFMKSIASKLGIGKSEEEKADQAGE